MTGFGKTTVEIKNKKIVIEIKSLNSKQLDLNLRMPALYKEKEMEIRSMVKEGLDRGKVDMAVYFDSSESDRAVAINRAVVEQYFGQLTEIAAQLGVEPDKNALLQTIMRFPDTLQVQAEQLDEEEWQALRAGITQALAEIDKFRIQEGRALIRDIAHRIDLIRELASQVPQFEGRRVEVVRQRLQERICEWTDVKCVDQNRLEQEIIYYWKSSTSPRRKCASPTIAITSWRPSSRRRRPGAKSDSSPRKSVVKSIPWAPKPMTTTSRSWWFG